MSERMTVIKSVYETNGEILDAIQALHCPSGFECDLTYGHGAFWRDREKPHLRFDITPMVEGVTQSCSTMLPITAGSLSNCVFDPPFLTYVKNAREHNSKVAMTSRYGGYYTYEELEDHYRHTISEAYRVLAPRGKLIFKCQDIVHNHKLHATHIRVVQMAEIEGFRLADTFILIAKNRMPSPQKGQQRHARIFHSHFLILERDDQRGSAG